MRDNFVAPVNILDDLLGGGASKPVVVPIADIRRDGATQPRAGLDNQHVEDLIQALTEGATLPAIDVMFDGTSYWVYDGFHRIAAHERLGRVQIHANVHQGAQTDAQWESYGVNKNHGLKRTNADKERAIRAALRHPAGVSKSDREIAKHVGVHHSSIGKYRIELESTGEIRQSTARTGADGRTINTAKIGSRPTPQPVPAKPVYVAPAAVLNTGAPEAPVHQPTVYTFEDVVRIGGDHIKRGVAARKPDDEEITHPLDCYEDAQATPYIGKMNKCHELKMWLKATRDEKAREYTKLTGQTVPTWFTEGLDHMIATLETTMDAVEQEAVVNANQ